jgi:hypothetical protein
MSKPEPKIKTGTMTASEVSKAWENFDKRFKEDMKETIKSIEKLLIDRQLSPLTQNRS